MNGFNLIWRSGLLFIAVLLAALLASCIQMTAEEQSSSTSSAQDESANLQEPEETVPMREDTQVALLQKLSDAAQSVDIELVFYDDFDRDGTKEMFVLNNVSYGRQIWFVSAKEIEALADGIAPYELEVFESGGQAFALQRSPFGSYGYEVYVMGVSDGEIYQINISQRSSDVVINPHGEVVVVVSHTGVSSDGTGRYWMPFYYYFGDGQFWEYGGIEITQEELETLPGALELLSELLDETEEITEIYYRGNGIININYTSPSEANGQMYNDSLFYRNLTLRYEGDVVEEEDLSYYYGFFGGGSYTAHYITEYAVFPDSFPALNMD